jgi:hypothetical protein
LWGLLPLLRRRVIAIKISTDENKKKITIALLERGNSGTKKP